MSVLLVGLGDERHHAHDHERARRRAEDVRVPGRGRLGAPAQPPRQSTLRHQVMLVVLS